MKKNMGTIDRILRVSIALVIGALYFTDVISGLVATLLGVVAVAFILTSSVGSCPLYLPFGLSTLRKSKS
jgi:hypothetical protein